MSAAQGVGDDWRSAARACLQGLNVPDGANLGVLYVNAPAAERASSILTLLRSLTGIRSWLGCSVHGVLGPAGLASERPGVAALALAVPDAPRPFAGLGSAPGFAATSLAAPADEPGLALLHGDPRNGGVAAVAAALAATERATVAGCYAGGGNDALLQISAGGQRDGEILRGAVAGAVLPGLPGGLAVSPGVQPIGPARRVTGARGEVVTELDDRPAFDAFRADAGEVLARNPERTGGYVRARVASGDSDAPAPALALEAFDMARGTVTLADPVGQGAWLTFVCRDGGAALADLPELARRGLAALGRDVPACGLYITTPQREAALGDSEAAFAALQQNLPEETPLVGAVTDGVIASGRHQPLAGSLLLLGD